MYVSLSSISPFSLNFFLPSSTKQEKKKIIGSGEFIVWALNPNNNFGGENYNLYKHNYSDMQSKHSYWGETEI